MIKMDLRRLTLSISGARAQIQNDHFELLGGLGLIYSRTRHMAAWGLLALLVAVYPANIHMLINEIYLEGMPHEKWLLWARMPMQFVFAAGVIWTGEIWFWGTSRASTQD